MFKKISFIGLVILLFFGFSINVSAASHYVFSVGSKYNDTGNANSDSRGTANWAGNYFSAMGYTKKSLPLNNGNSFSFSEFTSQINSSRYWIQSDIVYLVGHANYDNMSWKYNNNQGVSYAIAGSIPGYSMVHASTYSMSKVRLAVMMGCLTASGSQNISSTVKNKGAKSVVGWTTEMPASETLLWSNRFMGKLADNKTVKQAVDYANSFNYTHNDIKNTKVWGGSTKVPIYSTSNNYEVMSDENLLSAKLDNNRREYAINIKVSKTDDIKESLIKFIKERINKQFDISNYMVNITSSENADDNSITTVYDFIYKINGVKTNIGYTASVENDVITYIYDNMNGHTENELKNIRISKSKVGTLNSIAKSKEEMRLNSLNSMDYIRTISDEEVIYNVDEKKLYYVITVRETDVNTNNVSINQYVEEI